MYTDLHTHTAVVLHWQTALETASTKPTHCTLTCTVNNSKFLFFLQLWATCLFKQVAQVGFLDFEATSAFWATSLFFCPEEKSCSQADRQKLSYCSRSYFCSLSLFLAGYIFNLNVFMTCYCSADLCQELISIFAASRSWDFINITSLSRTFFDSKL